MTIRRPTNRALHALPQRDSRHGDRLYDTEKSNAFALQVKLDDFTREHGNVYIQGIQPVFEPLKVCYFDSSFGIGDSRIPYSYDIIFGRLRPSTSRLRRAASPS
jgi:fatty acid synthase subunit alpha